MKQGRTGGLLGRSGGLLGQGQGLVKLKSWAGLQVSLRVSPWLGAWVKKQRVHSFEEQPTLQPSLSFALID